MRKWPGIWRKLKILGSTHLTPPNSNSSEEERDYDTQIFRTNVFKCPFQMLNILVLLKCFYVSMLVFVLF